MAEDCKCSCELIKNKFRRTPNYRLPPARPKLAVEGGPGIGTRRTRLRSTLKRLQQKDVSYAYTGATMSPWKARVGATVRDLVFYEVAPGRTHHLLWKSSDNAR